jgi:hypothetical protein
VHDKDDDNVIETRSVLNTLIESDNVDNNGEPHNDLPPLAIAHPLIQRDGAGNNNEGEEVTLRPQGDVNVSVALRRASSIVWAEKNINSSNKSKECTSFAGAIVKLLERQQPSSKNERNERSAMMTMTIMRQMENLNMIMKDRDQRKRRSRKKKRAKKLAKKRKKRRALEGLDDHGGKAGRGGGIIASAAAAAAAATAARATVRNLTRVAIAIMDVEVGGMKGA